MKRCVLVLFAATGLLLGTLATAPPASSGAASSFNQLFDSEPFEVNGNYQPVLGMNDCSGGSAVPWFFWYAEGTAQDYLWKVVGGDPLTYVSTPLAVNGTYEVAVGDFDNDGCDDILFYAEGPAQDYVWYGNGDFTFTSKPVTINGSFQLLVGDYNGDGRDDVFFYAAGPGQEYMWVGRPGRTFTSGIGPTVNGSYRAVSIGDFVLFHAPGPAQDYMWMDLSIGATKPAMSLPVSIQGDYEPLIAPGGILLYAAGPAGDYLIYDVEMDGTLKTIPGTVNGSYTTGIRSMSTIDLLVWHAPGPTTDYLWVND